MSDPSEKRLKDEIYNAYHPVGMSTHSGKMTVLASDVERLFKKLQLAETELTQAQAELREARNENMCDACAGTGKPISGLPCQCGGSGKMSDAATYLRNVVFELSQRTESAEAKLQEALELIKY